MTRMVLLLALAAMLSWGQAYPDAIATREQLWTATNFARATLSGSLDGSSDTFGISVTSGTFTANMSVVVDREIVFCTGYSGGTFSGCTRGADGSAASAHYSSAAVVGYIVANHVEALRAEIIAIETALGANLVNVSGAGTSEPAYDVPVRAFASISLTSAATTNIIDVSVEAGLWMTFGCSVSAAVSGTPVVHLKWTVDGEAEQSQTLYNSSAAFVAEIRAASWNVGGDSVGVDGGGNQAFDNLVLGFYTPYATSLKVDVQVASTGTGTIVCAALRATELP